MVGAPEHKAAEAEQGLGTLGRYAFPCTEGMSRRGQPTERREAPEPFDGTPTQR
jgi:hypothetical protein